MNPSDPQGDLLQPAPAQDPLAVAYALQQQLADVRSMLTATFITLIILAAGLDLFIAKQWSMVQLQLAETRPQVARMATQFQREREPNIRAFLAQLQTFAAQNRDFQPVLEKYRIVLPQYLGAPVPAMPGPMTPTPGAKPPPKPLKK